MRQNMNMAHCDAPTTQAYVCTHTYLACYFLYHQREQSKAGKPVLGIEGILFCLYHRNVKGMVITNYITEITLNWLWQSFIFHYTILRFDF